MMRIDLRGSFGFKQIEDFVHLVYSFLVKLRKTKCEGCFLEELARYGIEGFLNVQ
jgi:hypothetical protein